MRKKLKGSVTIVRTTSNKEPDTISIRFTDATSGIEFVEATLSLEAFAMAVTGCGAQEASLEVGSTENLGKGFESEDIKVPIPEGSGYGEEFAKVMLVEIQKKLEAINEHLPPAQAWSFRKSAAQRNVHRIANNHLTVMIYRYV